MLMWILNLDFAAGVIADNTPQIPGAIKIGTRSISWSAVVNKTDDRTGKEYEYEFSNNRKFWTE